MKHILTISMGIMVITGSAAFADTLTLTSYYPAPFGAYDRTRLVPQGTSATELPKDGCSTPVGTSCCSQEGALIYFGEFKDPSAPGYNASVAALHNKVYVCTASDSDGEWEPLTGSGGSVWDQQGDNMFPLDLTTPDAIQLGIGTDTPDGSADMHIAQGHLLLGGGDSNSVLDMTTSARDTFRWTMDDTSGDKLLLQNNTSGSFLNQLTFDGTNNRVGVNTANPTATLFVQGYPSPTADEPEVYIFGKEGEIEIEASLSAATDDSATLRLIPGSDTGSIVDTGIYYDITGTQANLSITDNAESTGAVNHRFMTFDATDGNIGIGDVTDPTAQLTVRGGGNSSATAALDIWRWESARKPLLYVNDAGQVGLGTDAPEGDLHIFTEDGTIRITVDPATTLGDSSSLELWPATGSKKFTISAVADYMRLAAIDKTTSGWNIGMYITTNGRVGIHTQYPGVAMVVAGDIQYTGTCTNPSDRRMKKNIEPLAGGLDQVLRLRPVTFEHRTDEFPEMRLDEGRHAGFIAQELIEVIPQAAVQGEDGYYRVKPLKLIPHLVKSVQELNASITERTETLRQDMTMSATQLNALEQRVK